MGRFPMQTSFTRKAIEVSITLAKGSFEEGGNTVTINELACEVSIQKPGLPEKNSASVKIWGLSKEKMGHLTTLSFKPLESQHNIITIKGGERDIDTGEITSLSLIFEGEISSSYADFSSAPDISLIVKAETGIYPQQKSSPPFSIKGEVNILDVFKQFSSMTGYTFENQGVSGSISNAHFSGSPLQKIEKLARDIGCELIIDDSKIIVAPAGKSRKGNAVQLSKETGLIGYPSFNQDGITCKCLFTPNLIYGGLVAIDSIVPNASGTWLITKLTHNITANKSGSWESNIEASYYG